MPKKLIVSQAQAYQELPEKINTMSTKELQVFLERVLQGELPMEGDQTSLPHILLFEMFNQIDIKVRQPFENILLNFLSDLAQNTASNWISDGGDELLLLVSNIFRKSLRMKDPVDLLLYIVEERWDLNVKGINLHWRAAQTLISIDYRTRPQLWENIYSKGGVEYSSLIFAGMSISDLAFAFEWLKVGISNQAVFDAFTARIPLLREEYGADRLMERFVKLFPYIPESNVDEFIRVTKNIGINLISGVFIIFDRLKLLKLANELQIAVDENKADNDIRFVIEENLRVNSPREYSYINKNSDIEIISYLSDYIEKMPFMLSQEFRDRFVEYGNAILSTYDLGNDTIYFSSQVLKIQNKAVDIIKKLNEMAEGGDATE